MFKIDNGGPAFPRTGFIPDSSDAVGERLREVLATITEPQKGMTLFDYYLGLAFQGVVQARGAAMILDRRRFTATEADDHTNELAAVAVVYAHALMEAREEYLKLPRKPYNPEGDS